MRERRIPNSTYRFQFNRDFPLTEGKRLASYLYTLGISHVYSSPLLKARRGSLHCYDVTDHQKLNPEICTGDQFEEFCTTLRKKGISVILDIVPNHMAASTENPLWSDVLEKGLDSEYAFYFDIFWKGNLDDGRVVLPILSQELAKSIAEGKVRLAFDKKNRQYFLEAEGQSLPIRRSSFLKLSLGKSDVGIINNDKTKLMEFLDKQNYKLETWNDGLQNLNYRRFFNVADLVAIREESEAVFDEAHRLVLRLVKKGLIQALRIDHPDGLWDPEDYLCELANGCNRNERRLSPFYILIEKIVSQSEESLPNNWPTYGTTGYDFLNDLNGLFVKQSNALEFRRTYFNFVGESREFDDIAYESKILILERFMQPDIRRIARAFSKSEAKEAERAIELLVAAFPVYRTYIRETGAVSSSDLRIFSKAIESARKRAASNEITLRVLDRIERRFRKLGVTRNENRNRRKFFLMLQQLTSAVAAKGIEDTAFYRYFPLSSLNEVGGSPSDFGLPLEEFHRRNEQRLSSHPHSMLATSTHDTKRSEDVRARINVLSEMPAAWHAILERWPTMNNRFRKDSHSPTKNLEYLFYQTLLGSLDFNDFKIEEGRVKINDIYVNRLMEYIKKASKEAKLETSWIFPDEDYDKSVQGFLRGALSEENQDFLKELVLHSEKIRRIGRYNSLSQVILKATSPGVPDFYQGMEFFDYSLVDPDNRRPVDFGIRRAALKKLLAQKTTSKTSLKSLVLGDSPEAKLFVTLKLLTFRKANHVLFANGSYFPLSIEGAKKDNLVAFMRSTPEQSLIVVVSRFFMETTNFGEKLPVGDVWKDTWIQLPESRGNVSSFLDLFSGEKLNFAKSSEEILRLDMEKVLKTLPYAVLVSI